MAMGDDALELSARLGVLALHRTAGCQPPPVAKRLMPRSTMPLTDRLSGSGRQSSPLEQNS